MPVRTVLRFTHFQLKMNIILEHVLHLLYTVLELMMYLVRFRLFSA